MVTSEEIAHVPLFASLTAADRERLSRACADIRLAPGEYAVHEGDERALFVVLDGKIEVVKLVDGIERVLGERVPGAIFGEVPITLGTPFPSGFRAAEPSRVMRVERKSTTRSPPPRPMWRVKVGALARRAHRRAPGRRRRAAEAARAPRRPPLGRGLLRAAPLPRPQPDHFRVAHAGCARRGRALGRRAAGRRRLSGGPHADGTTLVRPHAPRGRRTARPADQRRRGRIRRGHHRRRAGGAGCGGLRRVGGPADDRDRAEAPGGQAGTSSRIENYLGFPAGVSGDELGKPRAAAGAPARRGDPRHAHDHRHRPGDAQRPPRRRRRAARRARSSSRPA